MNAYQHALDTKRIALNDVGLLAWVKHNQDAIMKALEICDKIETLADRGATSLQIFDDGNPLPIPTVPAFNPALDFDAEEQN